MSSDKNHNCIDTDELISDIKINIEKHGLQVILIEATDYMPSFAYSIGLWEKYNHPEIISLLEQNKKAVQNNELSPFAAAQMLLERYFKV